MEPFCVPESAPDPVPVECGDSVELEEAEGDSGKKKGRRWKRLRAHINPLSSIKFYYPKNRSEQWTLNFFPSYFSSEFYRNLSGNQSAPEKKFDHQVRVADVGCGFGGLLEALAPVLPRNLILGMEIREPVVRSVEKRIARLQEKQVPNLQAECPPPYSNIGVVNTNTMKYIVRFFDKGQLLKIFCKLFIPFCSSFPSSFASV